MNVRSFLDRIKEAQADKDMSDADIIASIAQYLMERKLMYSYLNFLRETHQATEDNPILRFPVMKTGEETIEDEPEVYTFTADDE